MPARQNYYDAARNITKDGTIQYSYGSNGRLSGVVVAGIATGYRYNGLGQRVAKSGAAGVAVHYVYDESGRLLGEYDGAGKAIQETVYLGDLPVAVLRPGTNGSRTVPGTLGINYVYADHLSTPRVLTRASDNKMVWRWDSADPFGLDQPDQNPSRLGELVYNLRFPGQVFDRETNNHYNYFRDYDPQTGRYVQSDPSGLTGGINTYGYVGGNPISRTDPTGELFFVPPTVYYGGLALVAAGGVWWASQHSMANSSQDERASTPTTGHANACPPKPGNQDPCKGFRKNVIEHEQKLKDYIAGPSSMDNRSQLAAAHAANDMNLVQVIISGRIAGLTAQIEF